jgi:hypothetical protein
LSFVTLFAKRKPWIFLFTLKTSWLFTAVNIYETFGQHIHHAAVHETSSITESSHRSW